MTEEQEPVREPGTVRVRLDFAYDGTNFFGWSKQPDLRTIEGELEAALAVIFHRSGSTPALVVAGRTDAGVHATGQVAHLDVTPAQLSVLKKRHGHDGVESLARRLNGIAGLHADIYVRSSTAAPDGFDARFSATWRRYEYRIADASVARNPLLRGHTLSYPAKLDLDAMNIAAAGLLGLHNWASYCKPRDGATTIRTLEGFSWERLPDGILLGRVQADAFCHSMVRSLVGASIAVGQGKLQPDDLVQLRDAVERTAAFKVVPANGLTLVEVGYPPDADVGARAELTRRRRAAGDSAGSE